MSIGYSAVMFSSLEEKVGMDNSICGLNIWMAGKTVLYLTNNATPDHLRDRLVPNRTKKKNIPLH